MIALLISDTDTFVDRLEQIVAPCGFDIIRYRSAVKALDNIEEIHPHAVFISTADFPRHWKTIVQYIRSDTTRDETVIVLLINDRFSNDEADKAIHIGVQAMIREDGAGSGDDKTLRDLFSRYQFVDDSRSERLISRIRDRTSFLFTNPLNDTIITGKVENLLDDEIRFKPDAPGAVADLSEGEPIADCTLKIGEKVFSLNCHVKKAGHMMILGVSGNREELASAIELTLRS